MVEPGPDNTQIRTIIAAALSAPDHGNLRAWRAVVVDNEDRRKRLGDLFVAAKKSEIPDAGDDILARERERGIMVPASMAVILEEVANEKVPVSEQYIALGAALQNMLLAIHSMGFVAKIVSGDKVGSPLVREAFGCREYENIACFICIGSARQKVPPKQRNRVEKHLEYF
jgi:nitroreductase